MDGITTASFTQAYRAFPVEQGNDVHDAQMKDIERGEQTAGVQAAAMADVQDVVIISSAAAQLYAIQAQQRRKVSATARPDGSERRETATEEVAADEPVTDAPVRHHLANRQAKEETT